MRLSENFDSSEMKCRCGCGAEDVSPELIQVLQSVRHTIGRAMTINSGRRCHEHNREVGGKTNSAHLRGTAADVSVHDSVHKFSIVAAAISAGAVGIGVGRTFVHIDVDVDLPRPAIWAY